MCIPLMMLLYIFSLLLAVSALAHGVDQTPMVDSANVLSDSVESETWLKKYGKPVDNPFSGFLSFSHIPHAVCLEDENVMFDIAILGFPFDTTVSYRPGARFGPHAIRSGSRRQRDIRGYTLAWGVNPYDQGIKVIDCGDVQPPPFRHNLCESAETCLILLLFCLLRSRTSTCFLDVSCHRCQSHHLIIISPCPRWNARQLRY
jgi:agmatinase